MKKLQNDIRLMANIATDAWLTNNNIRIVQGENPLEPDVIVAEDSLTPLKSTILAAILKKHRSEVKLELQRKAAKNNNAKVKNDQLIDSEQEIVKKFMAKNSLLSLDNLYINDGNYWIFNGNCFDIDSIIEVYPNDEEKIILNKIFNLKK